MNAYNGGMSETKDNVIVRPATMDDLEDISHLAEQLGYPNSLEDMQKRLQVILNNPEQGVFVVDTASKIVAGYIHAMKHVFIEVDPLVDVGGLVIDEQYRRQGLGKILLAAVESWAIEGGYQHIRLRSNIIREASHQFYKNMGYSINKTQYSFIKTLRE
jgi:GNAT superfamily N-acetyltransferase